MKLLIMDWPGFGSETIKKLLPRMGVDTEIFDFPQNSADIRNGEELGVEIAKRLLECNADAVFSFNYFPVVATAAHACRKKYISWVYDSPAMLLYSMTVFFPENYIFHFDSSEAARLIRDGAEHVFYLPLAGNTESYDKMIPDAAIHRKYDADIAMIGSMYREDRFRIFKKFENFDDYLKGYLEGLIAAQQELYGVDILEPALNDDIMKKVLKYVPLVTNRGDGYETAAWTFANYYLAMQVTTREREMLLKALSESYDVALYTPGDTSYIKKVRNLGCVDYYSEAPYAMKCAKINLNITLRSIHTGIPLRAMDIMACGGFLMSNYQADLAEAFVPGEDFVYYESIPDAVEKAGYYLAHEDERKTIAENGYRKVKEFHSMRRKFGQIFEAAGLK
ncbi:MAG: glycosyltransferase [Lachnospiraceae bacterium]|nr:glycosyltransferase [Lachnospiraceae bacterium]